MMRLQSLGYFIGVPLVVLGIFFAVASFDKTEQPNDISLTARLAVQQAAEMCSKMSADAVKDDCVEQQAIDNSATIYKAECKSTQNYYQCMEAKGAEIGPALEKELKDSAAVQAYRRLRTEGPAN